MKKLLTFVIGVSMALASWAGEVIAIQSPYSASHSGTPAMFKILDQANSLQSKYRFILEFKPGGEQIIAVKQLDDRPNDRLAIVAPKFVEHVESKKLNGSDYVPVFALGDACWAVISNLGNSAQGLSSLQGAKEIVVGGVGFGNAAHLTALQIAEKFQFGVRYIPFKSNFDALVLMASDNSVNMVIERVSSFNQLKDKNPDMKILAMSCPARHPDAPNVKTLKEQGVVAPYVFNIVVAHQQMKSDRRRELEQILTQATNLVGSTEIQKLSDMRPPQFDNVGIAKYTNDSLGLVRSLLNKHQAAVQQSAQGN